MVRPYDALCNNLLPLLRRVFEIAKALDIMIASDIRDWE